MESWDARANELFLQALGLHSDGERHRFLDRECGADAGLREQVESLLQASERAGDFLERPAPALLDRVAGLTLHEAPGTIIGPYKLLQEIGEGGFGVVFMAEQLQPVRRKVALKVIKPGMDTRQMIARFEAERQALALMDHPNIARVFDGGETANGRPYFVMELVRGVPITQYCDDNQLTPVERLGLFVAVCQAVQHAHTKGVIHRDLKPTNILVTHHDGTPVPKVIDFGVAKATQQQLTDKTLFTHFNQMVGTPLYMSPEQAEMSGLDVDTRSDIYSLGVLLYELLTGMAPFDKDRLKGAGFDEIRRILREEDPPRPSTRISTLGQMLTTVAAARKTDPKLLSRLVRGELDWVVMKALEKDRQRRYETASAFAADIQRYLHNEPVSACPASVLYRFRKFAGRYKAPLVMASLVVLGLLLATVVSTWLAVRATRAEGLAEQRLGAEKEAGQEAKRQLFEARLAQAKASRWSRRIGQRLDTWKALSEAAELARELGLGEDRLLELRNEAIGCLALADLRLLNEYEAFPAGWEFTAAFTADLECYARSDLEGNISVRRVEDNRELARLPCEGLDGPDKAAPFLRFSANGDLLAVRHHQGGRPRPNVRLWDWRRGKVLFSPTPSFPSGSLDLSPDSRHLALGHPDGILTLHEAATGIEVRRFPLRMQANLLAYHPDGTKLAVAGHGGEVQVRDATTGELLARWSAPGWLRSLAWHPNGVLLATGHGDTRLYLWDTTTGQQRGVLQGPPGFSGEQLCFAPDGDTLLSNGWDGCRLWDVWAQRELLRFPGMEGRFSRDGRRLAIRRGRDLVLWEVAAVRECRTLPRSPAISRGEYHGGGISPDGRWLAIGTNQGAGLWDLGLGKAVAFMPVGRVEDVQFHPSGGELFVSGGGGLFVSPVRAEPGRLVIRPVPKPLVAGPFCRLGRDHKGIVVAVSERHGGGLWVLDPRQRPVKARPLSHPRAVQAAVSPDGEWIASGVHHGLGVKIWQARTGKLDRELFADEHGIRVFFSPDGGHLLTATATAYSLWAVGTWKLAWQIRADAGRELGGNAAFTCDGKVLAITPSPSTALLFDRATRRPLARLQANDTDLIDQIDFSPDGSRLVAISGTGDAWVWDLRRIREKLREIHLDWDQPPYPTPDEVKPMKVEVDMGRFDRGFDPGIYRQRANDLARRARWAEAAADLARAIELAPSDHWARYNASVLHLELGDVEGYRTICREMLARFGQTDNPNVAERTAKTCLLAADAVSDYQAVRQLAKKAVTNTEKYGDYRWFLLARGMADYRAGQFACAIDWLRKGLSPGAEDPYRDGLAQWFLAMAHHRLGQTEDAREALARARTLGQRLPKRDGDLASWPDWLRFHIARREAEALLAR